MKKILDELDEISADLAMLANKIMNVIRRIDKDYYKKQNYEITNTIRDTKKL